MGMYTELHIGVEFKWDTPKTVIEAVTAMVNGDDAYTPQIDHAVFRAARWRWMLRSNGSPCFASRPCLVWIRDVTTQSWFLTVTTNIKNYDEEWERFIDFIAPYIETRGYIGHYRYEADEHPTLLYTVDARIEWRKLDAKAAAQTQIDSVKDETPKCEHCYAPHTTDRQALLCAWTRTPPYTAAQWQNLHETLTVFLAGSETPSALLLTKLANMYAARADELTEERDRWIARNRELETRLDQIRKVAR